MVRLILLERNISGLVLLHDLALNRHMLDTLAKVLTQDFRQRLAFSVGLCFYVFGRSKPK